MTLPGQFRRVLERIHFGLAADKCCQSPPCCTLKACAQRAEPTYFVNVDRIAEPFYSRCSKRSERKVALDQAPRALCNNRRTGIGQRLHPCSEIGGMSDRRVLEVGVPGP